MKVKTVLRYEMASLYRAFEPGVARQLLDRLEFVYTPGQGSGLNMLECEFSVAVFSKTQGQTAWYVS